jgi:hypothetical protein
MVGVACMAWEKTATQQPELLPESATSSIY